MAPGAKKGNPAPQQLYVSEIDPEKLGSLAQKLRSEFPLADVKVYMMHNMYTVQAPRPLSMKEVRECKYPEFGIGTVEKHRKGRVAVWWQKRWRSHAGK